MLVFSSLACTSTSAVMRALLCLTWLATASSLASIPLLVGDYPCSGTCQVDLFNLETGEQTPVIQLPSFHGMNVMVGAHHSSDVHYFMGCNASEQEHCTGAMDLQHKIRAFGGTASLTRTEREAWAHAQTRTSIWSVVTVDMNKKTATIGATLHDYGEAAAANVWEKTGELILLLGNDTHWVIRSVDPKKGSTLREIANWPQTIKNAFYHNTVIDQAQGTLYLDIGRMGPITPTDTLTAVDLATGTVTYKWREFNVLSSLSRLSYDSASPQGFIAMHISVTKQHKLVKVDIEKKRTTPIGVVGNSSWMMQQCNAILPTDRLWLQFVSDSSGFFVATVRLSDGAVLQKAPWSGGQDAMLYDFLPKPLKVPPESHGVLV